MLILCAAIDALLFPIGALLGVLAFASRRRILWIGVIVAAILGVVGGMCEVPVTPTLARFALRLRRHRRGHRDFSRHRSADHRHRVFFGAMLICTDCR
jgi:membrane protein YqaA with SNARE-associated domain